MSQSGSQSTTQSGSNTVTASDADADTDGMESATSSTSSTSGNGILLDVGVEDTEVGPVSGCRAIDVLFVLDGSDSMIEERAQLAATNAFTQIVLALEGLNGGGIDYRIGVTDDDDHGFLLPVGWLEPEPWFDSTAMDVASIAIAFNGASGQVGVLGGATLGCEHVLTSGVDLLVSDASGFVRDDALLLLVMLTDVDDFGAYDQPGGFDCGDFPFPPAGCATPPSDLASLRTELIDDVKGGQADAVAAIVVAGDPAVDGGANFCNQPASCGCSEVAPGFTDCEVFHASRLYDFAGMLGTNGVVANLCGANVPVAVEDGLNNSIDLACQNFEPEG